MSENKNEELEEKTKESEISEKEESEEEESEEEVTLRLRRFLFDCVNSLLIAMIAVVFLLTFVVRQVTVDGDSMTDTLQSGDRLFITNFMYTPQCGDIVIVSHGQSYNRPIIKRVIATGGQSLDIDYETGEVSVDGIVLKENYIKGTTIKLRDPTDIPDKIPEGYIFVMGDNREGSLDSRSNEIGLIPVENVIGKAQVRVYPLANFGSVYYNME